MDYRIGKSDLVIWLKEEDGHVQVGKVENVSSNNFKPRIGDGGNHDICGDPIYSWIFPKFYPVELMMQVRPSEVSIIINFVSIF